MAINKVCMGLAAALFLSLSVNFFLAGLMLGDALTPDAPPVVAEEKAPPEESSRRAEWKKREEALRAALSPADQEILEQSTGANKERFDALKADLDVARQAVATAMTSEPFDQAVLDAAIETETSIKAHFLKEMFRARRAVMEQLSPEGRKIFQEMNPVRRRGHRPPATEKGDEGHPRPRVEEGDHADKRRQRRERLEQLQDRRALPERPTPLPPGSPRPEEMPPPPAVPVPLAE